LSKIYQRQKRWEEAESILLESLHLQADNYITLTELAILYKKWNREEKSVKRYELKKKYVHALLQSYKAKPNNISILMELVSFFKSRRQYRVALQILNQVHHIDELDLESFRIQEIIYANMFHKKGVAESRKTGEHIIKKAPYVKFRKRFEEQKERLFINDSLKIKSLTNEGVYKYHYMTKEKYIETEKGNTILIDFKANKYSKIKNGEKVFYGLYEESNMTKVDCIEPVFTSLEEVIEKLSLEYSNT